VILQERLSQSPFEKLWRWQSLSIGVSQAVEHEADHGDSHHGFGHLWQRLVVFCQAAPSSKPSEGPFDNPSAEQEDETDGSRDAPHDDQGQAEQEAGEQGRGTVVDAVGEHRLKPAVEWLDLPQQLPGTVGILDVGGMDDDAEQQARGVDRDVALAPLDLFTRVVAARPPFSVVLTL